MKFWPGCVVRWIVPAAQDGRMRFAGGSSPRKTPRPGWAPCRLEPSSSLQWVRGYPSVTKSSSLRVDSCASARLLNLAVIFEPCRGQRVREVPSNFFPLGSN